MGEGVVHFSQIFPTGIVQFRLALWMYLALNVYRVDGVDVAQETEKK